MSELTVTNLSKKYKDKTALYPISFEATSGTCIVLCGGNGAGKSTMLQMLASILAPTTGSVSLNGNDLKADRKKFLKDIGYMPDDFQAQELMTVGEFLSFYASLRKVESERILEVLDMIGLTDKKKVLVKQLSKGMRQRLLFGQACLHKPDLLILDEPTNGLDPYWMNQFIELLKKMKKEGAILVFSTHMMDIAAEMGDRIYFMKDGKVIQTLEDHLEKEITTLELLKLHRQ
ncbi:ABC transporter ATP-binding protein [Bacillus massilinigeriensis]|uniref:ABC transporter ATP-binding protein n=1 Tax=Bacillus massilionigeriensis TaxID=1805475 RepID=UPI00096B3FBF|nr:ABC transporter ATP-binding protein [Bacillus massilionigeriensis]